MKWDKSGAGAKRTQSIGLPGGRLGGTGRWVPAGPSAGGGGRRWPPHNLILESTTPLGFPSPAKNSEASLLSSATSKPPSARELTGDTSVDNQEGLIHIRQNGESCCPSTRPPCPPARRRPRRHSPRHADQVFFRVLQAIKHNQQIPNNRELPPIHPTTTTPDATAPRRRCDRREHRD